jgi:hypothetical protein
MGQIANKIRNFAYFFFIGWIVFVFKEMRDLRKAKQDLLIDDYELRKKEIESGVQNESINDLISNNESLYKKPSGGGSDNP